MISSSSVVFWPIQAHVSYVNKKSDKKYNDNCKSVGKQALFANIKAIL